MVTAERWSTHIDEDHEVLRYRVEAMKSALSAKTDPETRRCTLVSLVIRALAPDLELHLRKEEQVLFPALLNLATDRAGDIVFLKEQHTQLRTILRQLAASLCECGCHSEKIDWKEVTRVGGQFTYLLEQHERKEEELLIDVLASSLKPQELMQLARGFHRVAWKVFQEEL